MADAKPREKRIPVRMCMICRERLPKTELIRYVRGRIDEPAEETPAGLIYDTEQTLPGRGMYHCRKAECAERFKKIRGFRKQSRRG